MNSENRLSRFFKVTLFSLLILSFIVTGLVFYLRININSVSEVNSGPTVGNLGGTSVSIPYQFAHFVEYEGDPNAFDGKSWKEFKPPQRTYESKLKSFGFDVRYPDMSGLEFGKETYFDKKKSTIFNTNWMSVGINVKSYHDEGALQRTLSYIAKKVWGKGKYGYSLSPDSRYGLNIYQIYGYEPAKRHDPWQTDISDKNVYFHKNKQGEITTYITCSNVQHGAARCKQEFLLTGVENTMVSVSYRIGFLSEWENIQDKVTTLLKSFITAH